MCSGCNEEWSDDTVPMTRATTRAPALMIGACDSVQTQDDALADTERTPTFVPEASDGPDGL